jgi:hypothetical protein
MPPISNPITFNRKTKLNSEGPVILILSNLLPHDKRNPIVCNVGSPEKSGWQCVPWARDFAAVRFADLLQEPPQFPSLGRR